MKRNYQTTKEVRVSHRERIIAHLFSLGKMSVDLDFSSIELLNRKELGFTSKAQINKRLEELESDGIIRQTGDTFKVNKIHHILYEKTPVNEVAIERNKCWIERGDSLLMTLKNKGYIDAKTYLQLSLEISEGIGSIIKN